MTVRNRIHAGADKQNTSSSRGKSSRLMHPLALTGIEGLDVERAEGGIDVVRCEGGPVGMAREACCFLGGYQPSADMRAREYPTRDEERGRTCTTWCIRYSTSLASFSAISSGRLLSPMLSATSCSTRVNSLPTYTQPTRRVRGHIQA